MSISTTSTKDSYAGNASITIQYPITFKYLEESHVSVYIDGVLQTKGAGADYVMGGDGTTNTGYITTNVAQADTKTITIVLDVPFDQPVDLQETGVLSSSTLEEAYDRLNMQIRRVWRKAQDVLTFSTDEGNAGSQGTADNLIGFDSSGDISEIPNTTFLQTANNLSDVTPATARANLNVDVAGTDNSTDVTKTGSGTYVSLAGQVLTVDEIDEGDLNSSINASLNLANTSIQSLANIEAESLVSTGATIGQVLQADGDDTCSFVDLTGGGNALTTNPLSQFASTTSAELAGVISDETGTGALVFADNPVIDLTNATNVPANSVGSTQIINGSIAKEDLDSGVQASLDLADTAIQTETNGTVQGTDGTYDIQATDEGAFASTTARGEGSVDLQTNREAVDQVASGASSVLVGGKNNKATAPQSAVIAGQGNTAGGDNSLVSGSGNEITSSPKAVVLGGATNVVSATGGNNAIIGGTLNNITGTASHAGILGGARNEASGASAVVLGGADNVASATDSLAAGDSATASHTGARVFADASETAFGSIATNEFAIQADALRLDDGNQGAGKVLTCDANGSGNWATPSGAMTPATYAGEESVTFPNGLIMKFGTIALNANTNGDVVFGSSFTTVVNAQASIETTSTNNQSPYIRSVTPTTLSLRNQGGASNTIHWSVVGY